MIASGDHSRTSQVIDSFNGEMKNLLNAAIEISYFSRGAWSYREVLEEPPHVRNLMVEFINKRLEAAGKSPFPVF
jgi:hypothetical protein